MDAIEVKDPTSVTVGGTPAGSVVDVLANHANDPANPDHAAIRAALHASLVSSWHAFKDAQEAHATATVAKLGAAHDAALTAQDTAAKAAAKAASDLHAAGLAAAKQAHADQLAKEQASHVAAITQATSAHADTRAELVALKSRYADLGGDTRWQATLPGRQVAAQARLAQAQAEVAAIGTGA